MSTAIRGIAPITNKRIGRILQDQRERRCLTLAELGTRIGVKHSTVKGWESGDRPIPRERIPALVEVLTEDPDMDKKRYRETFAILINPEAA